MKRWLFNEKLPQWCHEVTTPAMVYQMERLRRDTRLFVELCQNFDITCCYSVKANRHPAILNSIARQGLGFDVASPAEFNAIKNLNSGPVLSTSPGLTGSLMKAIDDCGGLLFFDNIEQVKQAQKQRIKVKNHGVRLTLPGDYAALGMTPDELQQLRRAGIKVTKIHLHAGEYSTPENLQKRLNSLAELLSCLSLDTIDFGGGFGVLSNEVKHLETALSLLSRFAKSFGADAIIEPGKAIVARCGYLVTTVLSCKARGGGQIAIVDQSSFNLGDMESRHLRITSSTKNKKLPTIIVGPTCYEGDIWGHFEVPPLKPGDRIMFSAMGAYTMSIKASLHDLPEPEVVILD
ncbi:TPA: diaminopimelate decarboxylase family protein [Vibrio diabolicus]